jgi:hypothetical protein
MLPTHQYLTFVAGKTAGNALIGVRKDTEDEDIYKLIVTFLDDNFKRVSPKSLQWFCKADESYQICSEIDRVLEELENEEDESDDELIQEALARRYKSPSSNKHIEDENVEDSESETMIKHSRRLRHIYSTMKSLREDIKKLQLQIAQIAQVK